MADFIIDGTNFGVEEGDSSLELEEMDGQLLLTLEVRGNEKQFQKISEDEKWSWALDPPRFYVHDCPVSSSAKTSTASLAIEPGPEDDFECALYLMEHRDVTQVVVKIRDGVHVEVSGRVALSSKMVPFRIKWSAAK